MLVKALKAKIHRAVVTDTKLDYPGSLAVDEHLLEQARIYPYESVLVANVTNGQRVETYVVPAPALSGEITVLGAAAKKFSPGDIIIIMNFAFYSPQEVQGLKPKVITVDNENKLKELL